MRDFLKSFPNRLKKAKKIPWIGHLFRTQERFANRNGSQSAAALTYFSVLAIVPLMMFTFATVGMILDVFHSELINRVVRWISDTIGGNVSAQLGDMVTGFVQGWRGIGLFGIISGLFVGLGWLDNLRTSVVAMSDPDFGAKDEINIFKRKLLDAPMLVVLLILLLLVFLAPAFASWIYPTISSLIPLDDSKLPGFLVPLGGFGLSLVSIFLFFLFVFWAFPSVKLPRSSYLIGSAIGAVIFSALQMLAPLLVSIFSGNKGVQVFGAIIIVMLMLNIFARIILYICAWVATSVQPAVPRLWSDADQPLLGRDDIITVEGHWPDAEADRERQEHPDTYQDQARVKDTGANPNSAAQAEGSVGADATPIREQSAFSRAVFKLSVGFGALALLDGLTAWIRNRKTSKRE